MRLPLLDQGGKPRLTIEDLSTELCASSQRKRLREDLGRVDDHHVNPALSWPRQTGARSDAPVFVNPEATPLM